MFRKSMPMDLTVCSCWLHTSHHTKDSISKTLRNNLVDWLGRFSAQKLTVEILIDINIYWHFSPSKWQTLLYERQTWARSDKINLNKHIAMPKKKLFWSIPFMGQNIYSYVFMNSAVNEMGNDFILLKHENLSDDEKSRSFSLFNARFIDVNSHSCSFFLRTKVTLESHLCRNLNFIRRTYIFSLLFDVSLSESVRLNSNNF